jgi:menaquinone-9 beta-reductase
MYDLIVIGGGPAGTSAAITAARAGRRVLLLERGRLPRQKVCGEFVSAESLGLLRQLLHSDQAGILEHAIHISQARLFLDDRVLQAAVEPAAASIARLDLDLYLWKAAEACGVEARQQTTATKLTGGGPFSLLTASGRFAARSLINASGRWSNVAGTTRPYASGRSKWIGLKAHYSESSPPHLTDLYFFKGGYCGVQPVALTRDSAAGRVNTCAMVRADTACTLPEVFRLHSALYERAKYWQPLTDPTTVAPLSFAEPQPVQDHILMAGDAAGFVDPFVGDGISLALRSGALAAQCLKSFFDGRLPLQDAAETYTEEYQRQFGPVFQSSAKIRRLLLWPRPVRAPLVALLAKTPAITNYLMRKTR